tara:strand:+ start:68 stop:550 length:483 start_codon:yes stop_codon:yes gene_type:complete
MRNKIFKYNFILIFIFLLTGCGFKILDKSKLLNFNIKEIEMTGNKKVNYHISNNIRNIIKPKKAKEDLLLKINSEQNKVIKEKNDKNQITKYQIELNISGEIYFLKKDIKKKIYTKIKGDYVVETNHESTLSNQNNLEVFLAKKASNFIINELSQLANDI